LKHSDTVYLLDSSIYIFRAWFGMPDTLLDENGRPVNAVYGYFRLLLQQIRSLEPHYLVAAFDESLFNGFRHNLYPNYKSKRALPDEALAYQLDLCKLLTQAAGITCLADQDYEADDLIAWAAGTAHKQSKRCVVISRDKDLAQVIRPGDSLVDWASGTESSYEQLCEHWSLRPEQIADLLALMGDAADGIPGIQGIGKKTATRLLQQFPDLETLYDHLDEVQGLPVRGAKGLYFKLAGHREEALLFRELTRLRPPQQHIALEVMTVERASMEKLMTLVKQLGLGVRFENLIRRFF